MRVLIVTHGPLANAMRESARMFFGDTVNDVGTIELYPQDSPEGLHEKIVEFVKKEKSDVLILVDIVSGSPYNMSALAIHELEEEYNIECFSGINMPVFMEVLGMKDNTSLEEMVNHIEMCVPDSIVNLRKSLEI